MNWTHEFMFVGGFIASRFYPFQQGKIDLDDIFVGAITAIAVMFTSISIRFFWRKIKQKRKKPVQP